MELALLRDVHFFFKIYLAVNKPITDKMQNIFLFKNWTLWLHKIFLKQIRLSNLSDIIFFFAQLLNVDLSAYQGLCWYLY